MTKLTFKDISASNYLKFSIPLFFTWLTQKNSHSNSATKHKNLMHRINKELKKSIHEMSDQTLTVRLLPMDQAMDKQVLSVQSACWIAQAYNLVGRMTQASKEISKHVIYLLDSLMTEDDERIIRTYLNKNVPLNYRVINALRYRVSQTDDNKLKESRLSAIDTLVNTDLCPSSQDARNAHKTLYKCYQSAVQAESIFKDEYAQIIRDVFKNLN